MVWSVVAIARFLFLVSNMLINHSPSLLMAVDGVGETRADRLRENEVNC